jgi:sugar lactone lactonase YvrE
MAGNDFVLSLDDVSFVGSGLDRPECVLATRSGDLYTCDWRGGIAWIRPDGSNTLIGGPHIVAQGLKPNGIALMQDGSFLFGNIGEAGGVWRLQRDNAVAPFLMEIDGQPIPGVNFVLIDVWRRVWISVSTTHRPSHQFSSARADGYIALLDDRGARIAADGLVWTNETRVSPDGAWLYVNETFAGRMTRFRIAGDGSLSDRQIVAQFEAGTFPDGLSFDSEGGVWTVCVVTNRLIRVMPDGRYRIVLEDLDPDHVARVVDALAAGTLGRDLVYENHARKLLNHSSLAFGGADLRTLYLGCISGDRLATVRMPVAGVPPTHWDWR